MFPDRYPGNLECEWSIVAEKGQQVQITFHTVRTERNFDLVQVKDGSCWDRSKVLATISGDLDSRRKKVLFVTPCLPLSLCLQGILGQSMSLSSPSPTRSVSDSPLMESPAFRGSTPPTQSSTATPLSQVRDLFVCCFFLAPAMMPRPLMQRPQRNLSYRSPYSLASRNSNPFSGQRIQRIKKRVCKFSAIHSSC